MAGNLQETIDRINKKAEILIEKYNVLAADKKVADKRIEELDNILSAKEKEIETLKQELEYLKIASTLAPDRNEVEKSRAVLAGLVREIDKCINELTE